MDMKRDKKKFKHTSLKNFQRKIHSVYVNAQGWTKNQCISELQLKAKELRMHMSKQMPT